MRKPSPAAPALARRTLRELTGDALAHTTGGGFTPRQPGLGSAPSRTAGRDDSPAAAHVLTSCFVRGTRLAVIGDTPDVAIEALAPFDLAPLVRRPDGTSTRILLGSAGPETAPVVYLATADRLTLGVSEYHPMVVRTPDGSTIRAAKRLAVGDALLTAEQTWTEITGLECRPYNGFVYNVWLDGSDLIDSHLVIANGLVTGDLALQTRIIEDARVELIERLLDGEDPDGLQREYRVTAATLRAWRDDYIAFGAAGLAAIPSAKP